MKIAPNIGTIDRSIRLLIVIGIIILLYTDWLERGISILLLILALILAVTSLISYSVVYNIFKINTIYSQKQKNKE